MSNEEQHQPPHIRYRSEYDSLREDMDDAKEDRREDKAAIWAKLDKHDQRISALERWQWFCYGIAAAVGALATHVLRMIGMKE